ncbi:MAG: hypothetical protein FWD74_12815, partial [Actinomycetia bacterium]|nr:hypothetical protein [Actinomycetes bacterium]
VSEPAVGTCPDSGCPFRVQIAPIGSESWRDVLPTGSTLVGYGVWLTRVGSAAYLLLAANSATTASGEVTLLYSSADDGQHWVNRGSPCGLGVDATYITSAVDGSVTVVCSGPGGYTSDYTATSTDGGVSFRAAPGTLGVITGVGAASASVLLAVADGVFRSGDGGRSWQRMLGAPKDSLAEILGFESATTGRVLNLFGDTIWTTPDAGFTWIANVFT